MGNKVKYNLKNVHAAKLTETVTDGVNAFTYAAPKAIPGAVSISLDAEGESSPFYADGIVYFRSVTNNGYSGDLEIALIPEWFRTEILQETLDGKGVLVENSGVGESVKFALLFEFDGDVNAIRQLHGLPPVHRVGDQGGYHRAGDGDAVHYRRPPFRRAGQGEDGRHHGRIHLCQLV